MRTTFAREKVLAGGLHNEGIFWINESAPLLIDSSRSPFCSAICLRGSSNPPLLPRSKIDEKETQCDSRIAGGGGGRRPQQKRWTMGWVRFTRIERAQRKYTHCACARPLTNQTCKIILGTKLCESQTQITNMYLCRGFRQNLLVKQANMAFGLDFCLLGFI